MLALINLIPLKDWLYTGIIVAMLIVLGVFTSHERNVGREQIEAADAKVAQAQSIHNTEVEARAKAITQADAIVYHHVLAAPPAVDAPHVWLHDDSSCASPVPANVSAGPAIDAKADVPTTGASGDESTVEHARDIGPSLDKLLQDADSEVTALQEYILACQDEGVCLK